MCSPPQGLKMTNQWQKDEKPERTENALVLIQLYAFFFSFYCSV